MNVGQFKKKEQNYIGSISMLGGQFKEVVFEAITPTNEKAPDYITHADGGEIGAAWKRKTKDGVEFLSVTLRSPFLAEPIYLALWPNKDGAGHSLIWKERREDAPKEDAA